MATDHPQALPSLDVWTSALLSKSGAGRGGNGKVEAYGIKRLRELIFELAAKGVLVDSQIGTQSKLVKIEDIAELVMGQAPPGADCNKDGVGAVFVKTGEFGDLYPEVVEWTTNPLKLAKSGDVLICVVGATVGKLNLAIDCAIGRSVAAIRPKGSIDTKYLYFALMPYTLRLRSQSRGSAQGVIGKVELNAVEIRLPSEEEQHRIVAKVDELMALCDQLEQQQTDSLAAHQTLVETLLGTLTRVESQQEFSAAWARIASHFDTLFTTEASIDQLKQTLLQLAVMGKLVPQDPNDEPAGVLLRKIASEKGRLTRDGAIRAQQQLPEVSTTEIPYDLPERWVWMRLGNVGIGSTGKTPSTANPDYFGGEVAFIGPGQITPAGEILDSDKTLTAEGCKLSAVAEPGDILMVCIGGSIGKSAIVFSQIAFNQQINCLRPLLVSSELLNYSMSTPQFQAAVLEKATGSATPIINRSKWEELLVPIPPEAEQHRIVAKVDELMALCDTLKARIKDAQTTQLHLADAIVEQAVC